ncbi:NADH-quinone oxidoreductase subunit L [Xanthobacter sp. TB0136]|uniref:NADH-quinone oxidoreductase subunit L n=1 Tax=Xanthobacter sp. TB0136 TaxID=3459177 RepID=UPI0040394766
MYQAIVFLPLVGFLIAGLFGRVIGARASEVITTLLLFISCAFSWVAFFQVGFQGVEVRIHLLDWIHITGLPIDWALRIDSITAVMLIVVTSVSCLVHLYSIGYMHEDPSRQRFFAYLSLFTFAMLMLVTADNLVQMFFGWEGVGLASYLLIGFWYEKPAPNAAAFKAFVMNRVGDFGFILGIFAIVFMTGSVAFDDVFAAAPSLVGQKMTFLWSEWDAATVIALLLFVGAMGKSAQLLLHTWLPDAMEGPTPVSALIHAATMVTAGVFMVARMSPIFELSPVALDVVMLVGATTCFFAATIALVQTDIKKVIAYSTCSQLGYMFAAMGAGAYSLGLFHLMTHGFFKALLFLCAGSVITAMHHEQDMRKMGGLFRKIPFTYAMMMIGTLAITGFPFTSGYYSKDAIIESTIVSANSFSLYGWIMTTLAVTLTSFYSWRLVFLTFHGKPRDHHAFDHAHEPPLVMTIPLAVLSLGALFAGYMLFDVFVGSGVDAFFRKSIYIAAENTVLHDMHYLPELLILTPTIMMIIGFVVAFWFYILDPQAPARLARAFPGLYNFLVHKWYFDEIYHAGIVRPVLWLGNLLWKRGDGTVINGFGPDGIAARVVDITGRVVRLQTGYIYHYAFVMLIGIAALLTWFMFIGA